MYLKDEELAGLTTVVREMVEEIQQENDPDDAAFLTDMQAVYSCLVELTAWRQRFPGVSMEPLFLTRYGVQRVQ